MKVSARNLLNGKVTALKRGAVNSEVELMMAGGHRIVSIITNESVEKLEIAIGKEVFALIKAFMVILGKETAGIKFSTRNVLEGTVRDITHGTVSCEVTLELAGGGAIAAAVTERSIAEMGLKIGDKATAMFKGSSVILAVTG